MRVSVQVNLFPDQLFSCHTGSPPPLYIALGGEIWTIRPDCLSFNDHGLPFTQTVIDVKLLQETFYLHLSIYAQTYNSDTCKHLI